MNNEQYNQIIDDAYENYYENAETSNVIDSHYEPATNKWHLYNRQEFIDRCKKDPKFSDKWELKIEERELSSEERLDIWTSLRNDRGYDENTLNDPERAHMWLDTAGVNMGPIPRRVTTVTYKDKTIEGYE